VGERAGGRAGCAMSADPSDWFERLAGRLRTRRHRCLLWASGPPGYARALATAFPRHWTERLWVGLAPVPVGWQVRPWSRLDDLLGGEFDCVVWDARAGLDPDGFGQVSGMIRAGGVLLLATPPQAEWIASPDAAARRILVAGCSPQTLGARHVTRLARVLGSAPEVLRLVAGEDWPEPEPAGEHLASATLEDRPGTDQAQAVNAIVSVWRGRGRRPLVLTADRGRGKSAALGLAAAAIAEQAPKARVVVTAPRPTQCEAVFRHAGAHPPVHVPPLALLRGAPPIDLLLVDEAAGLSTALLQGLLERHPRLVFASTVHGYEGNGRGFAIRFRAVLDALTPDWRELHLVAPMRWAADDPLEAVTFRLLLLDAAPEVLLPTAADHAIYQRIDRDRLAADESALRQVHGLLVQAHYRTRPMDLRNLLDGPNLRLRGMCVDGRWAAIALVAAEGGFERSVAEAIWSGQRRPHGHLLSQGLAAHAGVRGAARLPVWRVMRIAVHPQLQKRGVGSRLLAAIAAEAAEAGQALLGASFGATPALLRYWARAGCVPVRLGVRRDRASGCHSVIMVRALDRRGRWVVARAVARLRRELPVLLPDALQSVEAGVVHAVIGAGVVSPPPLPDDLDDLRGFAEASRAYETCLPALHALCWWLLGRPDPVCSESERALLVMRVLQARPWAEVADALGLDGRPALIAALRAAVARALSAQARADATVSPHRSR